MGQSTVSSKIVFKISQNLQNKTDEKRAENQGRLNSETMGWQVRQVKLPHDDGVRKNKHHAAAAW
jgi:hypothetical protein